MPEEKKRIWPDLFRYVESSGPEGATIEYQRFAVLRKPEYCYWIVPYRWIVEICLLMLQPHELYRAQGFPADYIIDKGADGRKFTKTEQVHMCGNSVSPPPMAALARANDPWRAAAREAVAA